MTKYLPLITRLTRQLSADDVPDARTEAIRILRERGHVHKQCEKLTAAGKERERMGPAARAIDRASNRSGHPKSHYRYTAGRAILK
jgi:hypothetical protein